MLKDKDGIKEEIDNDSEHGIKCLFNYSSVKDIYSGGQVNLALSLSSARVNELVIGTTCYYHQVNKSFFRFNRRTDEAGVSSVVSSIVS
jgi:hypothetical protein